MKEQSQRLERSRLSSHSINPKYIPLIATVTVFLLLYGVASIDFPTFFSLQVVVNFFIDNAFWGVVAVGMTFVMMTGGIDLSVGSMVGFVSIFAASLIEKSHVNPYLAIAICLATGSLIGFGSGLIIRYFRVAPFIMTLANMFLIKGLGLLISTNSIAITNPVIVGLSNAGVHLTKSVFLPLISIVFIIIFVAGVYVSSYTRFGRTVYAIGGNEQSATLMGLKVAATKVGVYTLSGFCSSLGGVIYMLYTSSGYAIATVGMELTAISAVVIGGTLLSGGVGYIGGTLVGVLILGVIQTFIAFQGTLSSWWIRIVIGLLLLLFILLQQALAVSSRRLR